jgi:hypothetical protein
MQRHQRGGIEQALQPPFRVARIRNLSLRGLAIRGVGCCAGTIGQSCHRMVSLKAGHACEAVTPK